MGVGLTVGGAVAGWQLGLALSGRGEMTLDGVSTGPLSAGAAVHVPPGVEHRGRALPSDGESFRMAYFALLDSPS